MQLRQDIASNLRRILRGRERIAARFAEFRQSADQLLTTTDSPAKDALSLSELDKTGLKFDAAMVGITLRFRVRLVANAAGKLHGLLVVLRRDHDTDEWLQVGSHLFDEDGQLPGVANPDRAGHSPFASLEEHGVMVLMGAFEVAMAAPDVFRATA